MLKAGVAELDITPPLGAKLRGYFEERTASTVHDPLFVRAFAIEGADTAVAIAVCDIIGLERKYVDQAKSRIAETTGLSAEQTAEILSDLGFPLEGIDYLDNDAVIDVEITSNRGDCLGLIGVAREISVATGKPLKIPEVSLDESQKQTSGK